MRKTLLILASFIGVLSTNLFALDHTMIGIVNFATCVSDSKYGKKEQENLENLRKQMMSMIEQTQKELTDLSSKMEDSDYLDGLSPKAEEELKIKFQSKNQDLARLQNQYYQILNQANYQVIQKISDNISKAAETVATKQKLGIVMNKEACFYNKPNLEVTTLVISEMDKNFELEEKKKKLSENTELPKDTDKQITNQTTPLSTPTDTELLKKAG